MFLPTGGAVASFSICFGVGMRQDAGRSFMAELEKTKNKKSSLKAAAGAVRGSTGFSLPGRIARDYGHLTAAERPGMRGDA